MTNTELRTLRQAASLTQEQAARLLNYTLRHYVRLERGDTPIAARWAETIEKKIRAEGLTRAADVV